MANLDRIVESFRLQSGACRLFGSPFTADLLQEATGALERGGVLADLIGEWPGHPVKDALPLRVTGALHAAVLTKRDATLVAAYPRQGNTADGAKAWPAAEAFIAREPAWMNAWLASPPQTNEVRRSAALFAGMMVLADTCKLPFDLLELGASAGLNQNLDAFDYRTGVWARGDAGDLVIETEWSGPAPPIAEPLIASRAACDQSPLDVAREEDRLRLTAYVWPDQSERLARLHSAIQIALRRRPVIDQRDAAEWIEEKMARRRQGYLTVVYHSIFLQYPPREIRARIDTAIRAAGALATEEAPLAWLRFEPEGVLGDATGGLRTFLDVITWPGGRRRILAEADPHGRGVHWFGHDWGKLCRPGPPISAMPASRSS